METFISITLIIINIFTVYKFLFNKIFIGSDDLNKSLRYLFTPDFIYLFRDGYWKHYTGKFKIILFIMPCLIVTILEHWIINGIIQIIINGR